MPARLRPATSTSSARMPSRSERSTCGQRSTASRALKGQRSSIPAQINAEQSPDLAPGAITGPNDTWIREPAGRETGKGGAFQSYIERDEAIERAAKGDPIAKDMMAFSFGSIGETPEERAEFWQKIETHMPGRQVHQFKNDPRAAA